MSEDGQFDIAIIGGGMVGSTLAACLQVCFSGELRIAVIEAGEFHSSMPGLPQDIHQVDARVSALSHGTYRLFSNTGAWEFLEGRANPFTKMDVWDADGTGSIQFAALEQGQKQLGFLVENRCSAAAMHQVLRSHSNISLLGQVRLESVARTNTGWNLYTASGEVISAGLLVGADGSRSWLRDQAGISLDTYDYRQRAVVATVKTEKPHGDCARQRFLTTGPLAFLPMKTGFDAGHISSIVWSLDEDEAERLVSLDDTAFLESLGMAFEHRLGNIQDSSRRLAFPLVQKHARDYTQERLVLVGDAAHTVHPLAGQGVNLGFLDVATLAEELFRSVSRGGELGDQVALRRYERRRKANNQLMMNVFKGFKLLFGQKAMPVRWARNAGMSFLNDVKPVKNHLVQQAMGMSGDLPQLVK